MKKSVLILFLSFLFAWSLSAVDTSVTVTACEENDCGTCQNGGEKIVVMENDIVTSTQYVCHGTNGSAPLISVSTTGQCTGISVGTDAPQYVCNGNDGVDGLNALAKLSKEYKGANCQNSDGVKIEVGIDMDGDGELNGDEINDTKYACDGINGINGHDALAKITKEDKGNNCKTGDGVKIEVGIDINDNGILDENEAKGDPYYVCNGKNGANQGPEGPRGYDALSRTAKEPAGSNCENGGVKIEVGNDVNGDRVLNDNEVVAEQTKYVCNGEQGEKGDQGPKGDKGEQGDVGITGDSGKNGAAALVSVADEPKGENCTAGGKKIKTGLDVNGNGTLDEDEVDSENINYVCNGMNAEEEGLISSSSGCALTSVDSSFDWIYTFLAVISVFFVFFTIKIIRR